MDRSNASTSSTIDYSGIGFERTMSQHFSDLKKDQDFVKEGVAKLMRDFQAIKAREAKWEVRKGNLKEEATKQGLMLSDIWSYSQGDACEEMEIEMDMLRFNQDRQDAFRLVNAWAQDSANQIAIYPGFDVEKRKKGAVDFVNLMKKYLRSTTPLGEGQEEEEEDKQWLASFIFTQNIHLPAAS